MYFHQRKSLINKHKAAQKKSLVLRPKFSKKEGRAGGFLFIFKIFLLNSLVKFHEEEFEGDVFFVLNITG